MSNLYLSLDLEMEQPSQEIIQIGACIGNISTGEVLEKFCAYVKIDMPLSPFIIGLTGITQETLDTQGTDLITAWKAFLAFRDKYPEVNCNAITWGGGDTAELKKQVFRAYEGLWGVLPGSTFAWPLGRRWIDVKTIFQFRQLAHGEKLQAGLAKAMVKCGMAFKGKKHNATDDAVNTFLLAARLVADYRQLIDFEWLMTNLDIPPELQ